MTKQYSVEMQIARAIIASTMYAFWRHKLWTPEDVLMFGIERAGSQSREAESDTFAVAYEQIATELIASRWRMIGRRPGRVKELTIVNTPGGCNECGCGAQATTECVCEPNDLTAVEIVSRIIDTHQNVLGDYCTCGAVWHDSEHVAQRIVDHLRESGRL